MLAISIALCGDQFQRVLQELQAIGILPARIGIGEVHADVAERERAQQRIRDGVRQHIGVRVAFQAELGWNRNAAQDQRPAGSDAMNVPALPDSQVTQDDTRAVISSARNRRARSMSDGLVILMLRSLPGTTLTST